MYAEKHLGYQFLGKYVFPCVLLVNVPFFALSYFLKDFISAGMLIFPLLIGVTIAIFLPIIVGVLYRNYIIKKYGYNACKLVLIEYNKIDENSGGFYPDIGEIINKIPSEES